MPIIAEHQKQCILFIKALELSLARLLSIRDSIDVKKAIYLHCAMILLYQNFVGMRGGVRKEYFDEFLDTLALDNEHVCEISFNRLENKYKFTLPSYLGSQELILMLKFSAVVLSESQSMNNILKEELIKINQRSVKLLVSTCLTALAVMVIETAIPSLVALPWLMLFLALIPCLLVLVTAISMTQEAFINRKISKLQLLFGHFWKINNTDELDCEIRRLIINKCAGNNDNVGSIPNLLSENECEENIFRLIPSHFFKLDKSLTLVQDDLAETSIIGCTA